MTGPSPPPEHRWITDNLLAECLESSDAELPLVLLWSARGADRSTVLHTMRQQSQARRPCALIDLASVGSLRPYRVLAQLMVRLGGAVQGYGRLAFPRFALGLVAIHAPIDLPRADSLRIGFRDLAMSRHQLTAVTRDVLAALDSAGSAAHADEPESGDAPAAGSTVRENSGSTADGDRGRFADAIDATATALGRRAHESLQWLQQVRPGFTDPIDALIDLRQRVDTDPRVVDEVLCDAFLTDLGSAYETGRFAGPRLDLPLVLLDHADSATGEQLLRTLIAVRHRRFSRGELTHRTDPALVVASGHTRFPSPAPHFPVRVPDPARGPVGLSEQVERTGGPGATIYQAWRERLATRPADPAALLLTAQLDRSDDASAEALTRHFESTVTSDDVAVAEGLTGGHPWGFDYVLRALAAARSAGNTSFDPRTVLHAPDPDASGQTVGSVVAQHLLSGYGEGLRQSLITGSAGRDLQRSLVRAILPDPPVELDRFRAVDLLVSPGSGTLHPLLRRVLLHLLALRPHQASDSWVSVHQRLQEHYLETGNSALELHHALAAGQIAPAVDYLDRRLGVLGAAEWLSELAVITAAPRMDPPVTRQPRDELRALAAGVDGDEQLVRLVIARWIKADPLGDPTGALDLHIAGALDHLAERAVYQVDRFYDEAYSFRSRPHEAQLVTPGR